MISGYDKNNKGNVIIIELKQWEKLQAIEGQDAIVETFKSVMGSSFTTIAGFLA